MKLQDLAEGLDDQWSNDEHTITLRDILRMTKDLPVKQYRTEKLAPIVLNWDNNPREIERIDQTDIAYPILIMLDERGKISWILDGHHRTQKAMKNKMKTVPVKLIRPSDLDDKARAVFSV